MSAIESLDISYDFPFSENIFKRIIQAPQASIVNTDNYKSKRKLKMNSSWRSDIILEGLKSSSQKDILSFYEVPNGKKEIKSFLSRNNDVKKLLFKIYKIMGDKFIDDSLFLELENEGVNKKILKVFVLTSMDGLEVAYKLDAIEDKIFEESNWESLKKFYISAEFK